MPVCLCGLCGLLGRTGKVCISDYPERALEDYFKIKFHVRGQIGVIKYMWLSLLFLQLSNLNQTTDLQCGLSYENQKLVEK